MPNSEFTFTFSNLFLIAFHSVDKVQRPVKCNPKFWFDYRVDLLRRTYVYLDNYMTGRIGTLRPLKSETELSFPIQ